VASNQTVILMFQNDTSPDAIFNLSREDGSIVDLTGASVNLNIQNPSSKQPTNAGHQACAITPPATSGQCQYQWQSTDLPIAGIYNAWLHITYSDGQTETAAVKINVGSSS
jgi:hypothetical protein